MSSLGIYFRNQVSLYVLFLVARVGSTYLTSLLNSHPNVLALGEELRDLEKEGSDEQIDWARNFLSPPLIGRYGARGFNTKLVHIVNPDVFAKLLKEYNCKLIHLQRQNRVKAVISRINGMRLYNKTGMWGLFDESNKLPPLSVDLEQFDEFLLHREKVDRELEEYVKSLHLDTLPLFYEDLIKDEKGFLDNVFEFLGVEPKTVEGSTLKITSDNLREAIENFDELRAQYIGTQYEPMFDEVLIP